MKSFLSLCSFIAIFLTFPSVYGATGEAIASSFPIWASTGTILPASVCSLSWFSLIGDDGVIVGSNKEYVLYSSWYTGQFLRPTFTLSRGWDIVEVSVGEKYARTFTQTGSLVLMASFVTDSGCNFSIEKIIHVYDTSILFVSSETLSYQNELTERLRGKGFLPTSLLLPNTQLLGQANILSEFLYKNLSAVKDASLIILEIDDPVNFMSTLWRIARQDPSIGVNLKGKTILIVTDQNEGLMGKLLAPHMSHLSLSEVYLVEKNMVDTLLFRLDRSLSIDTETLTNKISYTTSPPFYSVGRLVEFLMYHGFSIGFLGIILVLTVAILALNFLKQFIGMNVFGMYAPIFLAVRLYFLNFSLVALIFFSACIASLIGNAFVKRIYLLYNAKQALILTLYFVISILCISFAIQLGYPHFDQTMLDNVFIIFPFLMIIFTVDKIFNEEMILWSRTSLISMLQFITVTWVAFFIIRSQTIQYFLLSYTDIIFIILILNVLIWRFTGLQLFEYARFIPILKNIKEEE